MLATDLDNPNDCVTILSFQNLLSWMCSSELQEQEPAIADKIGDINYLCRGFDEEMRAAVASNLKGRGINCHPSTNITKVIVQLFWLQGVVVVLIERVKTDYS